MIGQFSGQGGNQHHQTHQGGSGGGGGLADVLNMADKLHIPGAHSAAKYSKYSKFMGGGFGQRGLVQEEYESFEGSEMGGSRELHEAALVGDHSSQSLDPRSPSPMPPPMQPPPGYEQWAGPSSSQHDLGTYQYGQGTQEYQYQTAYQDPYAADPNQPPQGYR